MNFYFNNIYIDYNIKSKYIEKLPIKIVEPINQKPVIEKSDLILFLNKDLQELSGKFQRNLQREFSLEALPKKL